ncbi:hypothetical protein E5288_WYG015131 [Bos mutus]|uniref:Uncharacterized protein n=1 Tax=Bos mutus TaxID=72004 RepID=A0A6B0S0K2_9CETA|nr:hypothetical protein [Bos mutus]
MMVLCLAGHVGEFGGDKVDTGGKCSKECRGVRATAQPWTPGGILRITSVSQADLGTYCFVAHSVANTRHSQEARVMLKEPAARFEIKLQAFSGNGDGKRSSHVVSRHNVPLDTPGEWDPVAGLGSKKALTVGPTAVDLQGGGGAELCLHLGPLTDGTVSTDPKAGCSCSQDESSSLPEVVVDIHVGLAALIICLLCLLLGWRHRAESTGAPKAKDRWQKWARADSCSSVHKEGSGSLSLGSTEQDERLGRIDAKPEGSPDRPRCSSSPSGRPLLQTGVTGVLSSASDSLGWSWGLQKPGFEWREARGED